MLAFQERRLDANIDDYLEKLPEATFNRLYTQPATCLAVLRLLPPLAKQILYRLVAFSTHVPKTQIYDWVYNKDTLLLTHALDKLSRLRIITTSNPAPEIVEMNGVFRNSLHDALVGGGEHASFGLPADTTEKHGIDVAFLDDYANQQWESVLHFMVGTSFAPPKRAVAKLLKKSNLMSVPSEDITVSSNSDKFREEDLRITSMGFQFLLQDVKSQVWILLIRYLELSSELEMDVVEVLNFIFMLGTLELGMVYSTDSLTETQQTLLPDLAALGLVYQRKKKSSKYYPTRLATSLTSGANTLSLMHTTRTTSSIPNHLTSSASSDDLDSGFIILETNYRIYAYTSSPLQIAVLSLFASLKARFRNMVVGMITRDSIRSALINGITAIQIIEFLKKHASKEMRKNSPVLPVTVVDQIRLWELERNRLGIKSGTLYSDFLRDEDFRATMKYANELDCVLWANESKRLLVITNEAHVMVKKYVSKKSEK